MGRVGGCCGIRCYFRHHHGSDPSIIPGAPLVAYEYVADKVPQVEPDVGFKEMIFEDPRGYYVRMIDHVATGHHRRVCAQFHTVYAMVYDSAGKELFRTAIDMPANLTEGDYSTRIFLTRGGRVISLYETNIDVRKVGWLSDTESGDIH